jgi:hypothetical protein
MVCENANACAQWWYTRWLALWSKGGEVGEEEVLFLSDRTLASTGPDPARRIRLVGAEEAKGSVFD